MAETNVRFRLVGKDFFDVYDNESVNYVQKVQDFSKIDNSFSDYTLAFNIPATLHNLGLIDFYNDPQVVNGFNPFLALPCEMYLNQHLFSEGTFRVNQIDYIDTQPVQIQVQFLADGTNLKTSLRGSDGEDARIKVLSNNWSGYEHPTTKEDVLNYLSGGVVLNTSGVDTGLKYPMASQDYLWRTKGLKFDRVRRIHVSADGILNTEVRPSLLVPTIVDQIFNYAGFDYDIKFGNKEYFRNLYMWVGNGKSYENNALRYLVTAALGKDLIMTLVNENSSVIFSNEKQDDLNLYNPQTGETIIGKDGNYTLTLRTTGRDVTNIQYRYVINGTTLGSWVDCVSGVQSVVINGLVISDVVTIRMRQKPSTPVFPPPFLSAEDSWFELDNGEQKEPDSVSIAAYMPEITCVDFLLGILRMFNAVMYWDKTTKKYIIDHRTEWLNAGVEFDLTDSIATNEGSLRPPEFFRTYRIDWQEGKDALNSIYFEANENRQYGAALYKTEYKYGEEYEQINTLTNTLWQEVVSVDTNNVPYDFSHIPSFQAVDQDLNQIDPGCRFMYFNGTKGTNATYTTAELVSGVEVKDPTGSAVINDFSNVEANDDLLMGYNAEFNYSLQTPELKTNSYYSKFYGSYVAQLYNQNTRRYTKTAFIDFVDAIDIKVNDVIVIGGKKYMINEMRINFLTGKVEFSLVDKLEFPAI